MPGVVAGRLGAKGVMVIEGPSLDSDTNSGLSADSTDNVMTARATAPRGGLSTILKISPTTGAWLRQRNLLLRDVTFPPMGKVKVLICENGTCREEGLEEDMGGLGLGEQLLPTTSGPGGGEEVPHEKVELAKDGAASVS